ncbi:MAG: DUF2586 domain-containing protein [Deferribacterales bacterium]
MNDVFEYIVDGTSGLAPGDVSGSTLVTGVCSAGTAGKAYLLGKSSNLNSLLGYGALVDALRDLFATGGQDAVVVAVPCAGIAGGYITNITHAGDGAEATVSGVAAGSADVVIKVDSAGVLGVATVKVSVDGGTTYGSSQQVGADGILALTTYGANVVFAGDLALDDTYSFAVRTPIGPVKHVGTGPNISVAGTVTMGADIILLITSSGGRNEGTYQLSLDGDNYGTEKTIPSDGVIKVGSTGVTITFPDSDAVVGDTYTFRLLAPVPTVSNVMSAIEQPLEVYDVENVYVVGPTDSVDWASFATYADELFNKHRPTYFLCESRMPYSNESIDDWTTAMIAERQGFSYRFLTVCAAYGEISASDGYTQQRNAGGLLQGRILSIPVMRSVGRVRDAAVSQLSLPEGYNESHITLLAEAGYTVAKFYAGLDGTYWEDAMTMADDTSDFLYLRVVRTVFKALRLARKAALKSMYDEVGDPIATDGASGLTYLATNIEGAVNTMAAASPQELAECIVTFPDGQDIVNNGIAAELELIGIPVIKSIKLYARYVYAGSSADSRLEV